MLTTETSSIICKLLTTIGQMEDICQNSRVTLNKIEGFSSYNLFKYIDKGCKNYLEERDFIDFLQLNSIFCSVKEVMMLILFYDLDDNLCLSYSSFLNMLIADWIVHGRTISSINNNIKSLPYSIEYATTRVIEKELDLIRAILPLIELLKERKDFNVYTLFTELNDINCNNITFQSLKGFFYRYNVKSVSDIELTGIIRRLDLKKNGRVTIEQLEKIFAFPNQHNITKPSMCNRSLDCCNHDRSLSITHSPYHGSSQARTHQRPFRYQLSPNLTIRECPERKQSPTRRFDYPIDPKSPIFISKKKSDEEILISFMKDLMEKEYQIEKKKIDLAIKSDFSMDSVYQLFDPKNKGYITEADLQLAFHSLEIYPSHRETILLIKQYDLSCSGVLTFKDLFDMLTPFDKEYRHLVENRKPSPYQPKYNKVDLFLSSTLDLLSDLLKFIIFAEFKTEAARTEINRLYGLNMEEFFKKIDRGAIKSFSQTDLDLFLKDNNSINTPKEIALLFIRLDRLREGKVSLRQLLYETIPRCPYDSINEN